MPAERGKGAFFAVLLNGFLFFWHIDGNVLVDGLKLQIGDFTAILRILIENDGVALFGDKDIPRVDGVLESKKGEKEFVCGVDGGDFLIALRLFNKSLEVGVIRYAAGYDIASLDIDRLFVRGFDAIESSDILSDSAGLMELFDIDK